MAAQRLYKIKLRSGRVVGPIELARVRRLIEKKHVLGDELAREHPDGEWVSLHQIPALSHLVVASLTEGKSSPAVSAAGSPSGVEPRTAILPGATQVLPPLRRTPELASIHGEEEEEPVPPTRILGSPRDPEASIQIQDDRTQMAEAPADETPTEGTEMVRAPLGTSLIAHRRDAHELDRYEEDVDPDYRERRPAGTFSQQETIMFRRPDVEPAEKKRDVSLRGLVRATAVVFAVGFAALEVLTGGQEIREPPPKPEIVRPSLPSYSAGAPRDPQKSARIYADAMQDYLADNVTGYLTAAKKLLVSASHDPDNVKALAMLASSYLNLIDSSNKDEKYFSVISTLIERTRARQLDLPETVIGDVEFYIAANKPEAAQLRIVEYTKRNQQTFGLEMFYYIALAFHHRGDAGSAARYISQYPDAKAFSPKIFYLRGAIAERLNDPDAAVSEYLKAIKFPAREGKPAGTHAKSRLALADLMKRRGRLKEAAPHVEFLVKHRELLAPRDLAHAYYLHSLLSRLNLDWETAIIDIERATRLDRLNSDYLLELYSQRAEREGGATDETKRQAGMYTHLAEGERHLKERRYHEALSSFLQARKVNDRSSLPLIRVGDMFANLGDVGSARLNYKLAADRAPASIEVWSKYISVLIQSYEWELAQKAMDRFRRLPVSQSAIDKAAADLYAKQGRPAEAQAFYKKAMSRDSIDPDVYLAFARSLKSVGACKEAPFFYALALRFDPLNVEATIETAQCVAQSESIERGISLLQDELQRNAGARAEILSAIADMQTQRGDWELAERFLEQAKAANPDSAAPFKVLAKVYLNREGQDRDAIKRALEAYKSYSDRMASDPAGYLERYGLFVKQGKYADATEELNKIYAIYPKYPNLHFYKGALFSMQGNHKAAIEEFKIELGNNPDSLSALLGIGKELIQVGAHVDALTAFTRAMRQAPRNAEAKQLAGYANFLLKNQGAAIALYRSAAVLDPANPLIYKRLGLAYRAAGDPTSAAQAFRKYLEMEPDAPDRAEFERQIR